MAKPKTGEEHGTVMTEGVVYRVSIPNPHDHLVRVEMAFMSPADGPTVSLPSWTPGSYLLREYARHVQELSASSEGEPCRVEKRSKSTWVISAPAGARVEVRYAVYAHELSVRTPHVDGTHAFLATPGVFAFVEGLEDRPLEVHVAAPEGWQVFTTLPSADPETGDDTDTSVFRAEDYDHLADAFFEMGPAHEVLRFEVRDVPHELIIWGRGNYDAQRLGPDLARVVEQNATLFGGLPYARYVFVLHLGDAGKGGLEHRDGCVLAWQRHRFKDDDYDDFLRLVAHEHFHVWNVKRIRPAVLGPFDYLNESYTRALWAMEGVTSYYDQRQLLLAGLISPARYLELVGRQIKSLEGVPGRRLSSLEEASFDAWIKLYRPHENLHNATVSYYLLGSLVTLVLDLEIRRATGGERSYDDVMTALWAEYLASNAGLPDDAFKSHVVDVGGPDLMPWVERYVEGRGEIDWAHHLNAVGLAIEREEEGKGPYFGITKRNHGSRVKVASVLSDGPNAGGNLYPGDEIAAIDGHQVRAETWDRVLKLLPLEGEVALALFRRGQLVQTTSQVVPHPGKPKITASEEATEEQLALRLGWLGSEL